jgi:hypothetical protein
LLEQFIKNLISHNFLFLLLLLITDCFRRFCVAFNVAFMSELKLVLSLKALCFDLIDIIIVTGASFLKIEESLKGDYP